MAYISSGRYSTLKLVLRPSSIFPPLFSVTGRVSPGPHSSLVRNHQSGIILFDEHCSGASSAPLALQFLLQIFRGVQSVSVINLIPCPIHHNLVTSIDLKNYPHSFVLLSTLPLVINSIKNLKMILSYLEIIKIIIRINNVFQTENKSESKHIIE